MDVTIYEHVSCCHEAHVHTCRFCTACDRHSRCHCAWAWPPPPGGGVQVCAHCVYAWADKPDTWQCPALLPEKRRERRTLRKAFTGSRSDLCRGGMEGATEGQPLRGLMPSVHCTPGATEPLGILSSAMSL